jgi:iron-sulfur cluster repair protein YtfE (RIC family)
MDALDILKTDHDRVKSLYEQLKKISGRQEQVLLFESIRNELQIHTRIEESVFYPAFKNYPDFKDIIDQSYEEHRQVRDLLKNAQTQPQGGQDLLNQVETLMSHVEQHVQEEETELFPMVRKIMKRSEREKLGRHLQAAKSEAAGSVAA